MWRLRTFDRSPIFGSNIHSQIIPITIIGVINGRKYAVLKNSDPLIFEFNMQARINGIIIPKTEVDSANTIVFIKILKNKGSVNISL